MSTAAASAIKSISPQLLVADIERSLRFYTSELGFVSDPDGYILAFLESS